MWTVSSVYLCDVVLLMMMTTTVVVVKCVFYTRIVCNWMLLYVHTEMYNFFTLLIIFQSKNAEMTYNSQRKKEYYTLHDTVSGGSHGKENKRKRKKLLLLLVHGVCVLWHVFFCCWCYYFLMLFLSCRYTQKTYMYFAKGTGH